MPAMTVVADRLPSLDRRFGWAMTAPGLVALSFVVLFPLFFAILTSGFEYTLLHRKYDTFVWLDNYRSIWSEAYLGQSLWVTTTFVVAVVLLEFLVGFTVALMLNAVQRFKDVYYLILLMPLLINPVVVGLIWRIFLHPELGIVNYVIGRRPRCYVSSGRNLALILTTIDENLYTMGISDCIICTWYGRPVDIRYTTVAILRAASQRRYLCSRYAPYGNAGCPMLGAVRPEAGTLSKHEVVPASIAVRVE